MRDVSDVPSGDRTFVRLAGALAILAGVLALATLPVFVSAVHNDPSARADIGNIITIGADGEGLRVALILDMLGYYLFLLPLALALHRWLSPKRPGFAMLYTGCGLMYVMVGAIGAAILAAVWPVLISQYAQANSGQREMLEIVFRMVSTAVKDGMWNTLESLPVGIWWVGMGSLLWSERRILGGATMILGALALLNSVGVFGGIALLGPKGLGVAWVMLTPFWTTAMGINLVLMRKPRVARAIPATV